MSEKKSKRSPYRLREGNKKTYNEKKIRLEYEQQAYTSHQNKIEICSFVEKCLRKAQDKKVIEFKIRNLTKSMKNSYSGLEKKFLYTINSYYFWVIFKFPKQFTN